MKSLYVYLRWSENLRLYCPCQKSYILFIIIQSTGETDIWLGTAIMIVTKFVIYFVYICKLYIPTQTVAVKWSGGALLYIPTQTLRKGRRLVATLRSVVYIPNFLASWSARMYICIHTSTSCLYELRRYLNAALENVFRLSFRERSTRECRRNAFKPTDHFYKVFFKIIVFNGQSKALNHSKISLFPPC